MSEGLGLIISPPILMQGTSLQDVATDLAQAYRFRTLFWDHLSAPINPNCFHREEAYGPDAWFLAEAGVLLFQPVEHFGGPLEQTTRQILQAVLNHYEAQEPGRWALHLGPGSLEAPGEEILAEADLAPGRGLLVSLHDAIPVPDKDVPLNEILEFKHRRADELSALRHHLARIYDTIAKAGDGPLLRLTELEGLKSSIRDYTAALSENRLPSRLLKLDADFNVAQPLVAGITAAAATAATTQSITLAVTNALVGSLAVTIAPAFRRRKDSSPFRYLARYNEELFGV